MRKTPIELIKIFKIESNFNAIYYVFSLLFPKIYNRTNNFGVQKESNFSTWKTRKQNNGRPIAPKIINEMPAPAKEDLVTDMLSKAKNPKDYQNREVNEFEQTPLYFEKSVLDHTSAPIAPAHKYRMTTETVEIKKKMGTKRPDGTTVSTEMDGSAKKVMGAIAAPRAAKSRDERKKILQRQLSENTAKMNIIKKSKNQ